MATLVLTVIGDDRSGLVEALSSVIARYDGNWERSRMAELAGKFAGIVSVTVPDAHTQAMIADLGPLSADGLLDVTVEEGNGDAGSSTTMHTLNLVGTDQPGIVRHLSAALAACGVSIVDLRTETSPAPMTGGMLFEATAVLETPADVGVDDLRRALEAVADTLMVDIDLD